MEINHFSHQHTLVLSEEKRRTRFTCAICDEFVFGLSYCCQICPHVIHKWCAELSRELLYTHGLHPQTLILSLTKSSSNMAYCKVCNLPIEQLFSYVTIEENSLTKYHLECASFPVELLLNHEISEAGIKKKECCTICHVKDNLPKLIEQGVDKSYRHIHCAMLPRKVKHNVHIHELTIHPPLIEDEMYFQFICDACEKDRDPASPVYYCEPCKFVAQIGCGVTGSETLFIHDIVGTNLAYISVSSRFVLEEEMEDEEDENEEAESESEERDDVYEEVDQIEHFSHEHPLVLKSIRNFSMPTLDECCGCGQSICGLTYVCIEKSCEGSCFYLHKWCGQLPYEIHCSMHPHHGPLELMQSRLIESNNHDGLLVKDYSTNCEFCGLDIGLMSYGCNKCNFQIHGLCALLPNDLKHQSHEHTLTAVINKGIAFYSDDDDYDIPKCRLALGRSANPLCQACGFLCEGVSLECKICDFHLHVHCFFLPDTGKHTTHKHDLRLTYSYEEDPIALEFICDTCEKPRNPNRWVYCCPDPKCSILSHIDCVVSKYFNTFKHQN